MADPPLLDHPLLAALPDEVARSVSAALVVRDLAAGEVLVRAGEPGGALHIVETGWLDVLGAADGRLLAQVGRGAVLGELGFLRQIPSAAQVRATTDAVVHSLPPDDARRLAETYAGFALALGRVAAERVAGQPAVCDRPVITAVVEVGPWSDVRVPMLGAFGRLPGSRVLDTAELGDDLPGRDAALRATRALGEALAGASTVVLWTGAAEPGLSRALRSADRVLVLQPRAGAGDDALLARIRDVPANPSANIIAVGVRTGGGEATVTPSAVAGVRQLLLPGSDVVGAALREFQRLIQLESVLARSPVFGSAPLAARRDLARHMSWGRMPARHIIYAEGQPVAGLYLVLSGRVIEIDGADRQIGHAPGFTFGDDARGPVRPAAATARTVRETLVAFVGRPTLRTLLARHETLREALAGQAGTAVVAARAAAMSVRASIVVVLPDRADAWRARVDAIGAALGPPSDWCRIDRAAAERRFGPRAIESGAGTPADSRLRAWFGELEERHRYRLFVAERDDARWLARCLGQTDHRLLVVDGLTGDPAALPALDDGAPRHLALWWPRGGTPSDTRRWLRAAPDVVWHHVREGDADDTGRMIRRMLQRATGLVLGGASSRSIAHLGVAAGIGEAGPPIDTFAGTSSGAAVAALLCLGLDPAEARRRAVRTVIGFRAGLDNLGPPFVSIFSGRRARRLLKRAFGDRRIEDLVRPLKATAVDLRKGTVCVLDRGPIWQAVRASSSLPALWPPVVVGGRVLVDGGMLDNFPSSIVEAECRAGRTFISNLDAGFAPAFAGVADYGTVVSGWRVLWNTLLRRRRRFPMLTGTVIESMVLGGRASSADLEDRVDPRRVLVLRPPIPKLEIFGLEDGPMVDALIGVSRDYTRDAVGAWMRAGQAPLTASAPTPAGSPAAPGTSPPGPTSSCPSGSDAGPSEKAG